MGRCGVILICAASWGQVTIASSPPQPPRCSQGRETERAPGRRCLGVPRLRGWVGSGPEAAESWPPQHTASSQTTGQIRGRLHGSGLLLRPGGSAPEAGSPAAGAEVASGRVAGEGMSDVRPSQHGLWERLSPGPDLRPRSRAMARRGRRALAAWRGSVHVPASPRAEAGLHGAGGRGLGRISMLEGCFPCTNELP